MRCPLFLTAMLLAAGAAGEPPTRVVTLAPHLAELAFAAGAGETLVGVSAYSDYPHAVRSLPVVGDAFMVDQERLAMLRPDLLLAWQSGTPEHVIDALRQRGYRVAVIRTRGLGDIAAALRRIGQLTGHAEAGRRAARVFELELRELAEKWQDAKPIRVFYQVSRRPLYTVNGEHYVSDLIAACGGRNVFADLGELAPLITEEAVLKRDPEVMLAADVAGSEPFAAWHRWPALSANRYDNRFLVPAAAIGRATPRLLDAGRAICTHLATARERANARGPR